MPDDVNKCPNCGETMAYGFIGPPNALKWFGDKETVWSGLGQLLSGKRLTKGWFKNLPAWRCPQCHLVLFFAQR
jgi:hypothetical protein